MGWSNVATHTISLEMLDDVRKFGFRFFFPWALSEVHMNKGIGALTSTFGGNARDLSADIERRLAA